MWSDESRFNLLKATDGKTRVLRLKNERYNPNSISKSVKWNDGGVMIWGSFCNHMLGPCYIIDDTINSNVYIEKIMTPFYSKFYLTIIAEYQRENVFFQHDNASAHTSTKTRTWLAQKKIQMLYCPPQSSNQNPTEHVWDVILIN